MQQTEPFGKAGKELADILGKLDLMAVMALNEGRFDDALACYEQSYSLWVSLGLENKGAKTLVNIANVLYLLNRYSDALEQLRKAESVFRSEGKIAELQDVQRRKAGIYIADGRLSEARQLLDAFKRKCKTPVEMGEYSLLLYFLLRKENQYGKSKKTLDRAVQYFETAHDNSGLSRALQIRVQFYEEAGQRQNAELDRIRITGFNAQE